MKYEDGFNKFEQELVVAAKPYLQDIANDKNKMDGMTEVFSNILLDKPGPRRLNKPLSTKEQLFYQIWNGFSEIREAISTMREIEAYIRHFPPKATGISKNRFLRYHIANYLNEVYILKERLEAYHKKIMKFYRKDSPVHSDTLKEMPTVLSLFFDSITKVRGAHVHNSRYNDLDLDRLSLLEVLLSDGEYKVSQRLYSGALKKVRQTWVKKIISINKDAIKVLDMYFSVISGVVFDQNRNLRIPSNYRIGNSS